MKTTKEEDKILALAHKAGKRYTMALLPPGSNPDTQKSRAFAVLLSDSFKKGIVLGRIACRHRLG